MDDFVSKPVRIEEFEDAFSRCLKLLQVSVKGEAYLLDHEILQSVRDLRTPGEPDPLVELIDLFLQDTPPRITKILDAFKAGDAAALERAAHSLKGSSSNLGANHLASACFEVMNIAKTGKLPEAAAVAKVLSEFERLKPALEKERQA
jgi:HPt (histidine-containing phosphotransfer) domain-containing protein